MKKLACFCVLFVTLAMLFSVSVGANGVMRWAIHVNFENMDDELCYGTLLSKHESNDRYSPWEPTKSSAESSIYGNVWLKFAEYEDEDGFYFWGEVWKISETQKIYWGYYPPTTFKLLIYYPATDTFEISDVYSAYATRSYFDVDMSYFENGRFVAEKNYRWGIEIAGLLIRMLATIVIELLIAAAFGFWSPSVRKLIIAVNFVTQILINVALNIVHFKLGDSLYFEWYLILEIAVFVIEAVIYSVAVRRREESPRSIWFYIKYSAAANFISFISGILFGNLADRILK